MLFFYNLAGFAIATKIVTRTFPHGSDREPLKRYTLTNSIEDIITSLYGGFCFSSPRTPLVGSSNKTLYLPPGQHTIVFYTYFNHFNIDLTVNVDFAKCTGIVNICKTCSETEIGMIIYM